MWEYAILVGCDKKQCAKKIYENLKSFSTEVLVTIHEKNNVYCITTACEDIERFRYKNFLEETIIDIICNDYKKEFLNENLSVLGEDEIANEAFLQALLYFDRETDRYIVAKYLQIDKQNSLDGFFNFRLKTLKDKWQELIQIANDNQIYLYSDDTFLELIKFLIDNIEFKSDVINIVEQNNKYIIMNSKFEQIEFDCKSDNIDKNFISCLIALCPKNINIYCSEIMPNNLTNLICSVFEKRVRFLTN